MLFALVFLYFTFIDVQALPISAIESANTASTCDNLYHCRTIWNILWTCLVTISACTWVTVHPNVPAREDGRFMVTFRRVKVVLLALIMPELIVLWAIRQWLKARQITRQIRRIMRSSDGKYRTKDGKGFSYLCSRNVGIC
jgi:hypothetical protein